MLGTTETGVCHRCHQCHRVPLTHWVRCLILTHWVPGCGCLTLTHGVRGAAGGDGTRPGCAVPGRRGGAGFEGAGEGRRRVGRWQGGITEPVKIFSKIRNPVGP